VLKTQSNERILYHSTRGEAPEMGFVDVMLAGLAEDGGLYLPKSWPQISHQEIASFAGQPYEEVAYRVIHPFVGGDIPDHALKSMIVEAYATFRHKAVAPLIQLDENHFILELFHGTTLAFKDVAMQLLARLMDYALKERNQRATIVGATSGDTGGAALDAFSGRDRTDIFILFPKGRVSDVQRRQMTTLNQPNAHALAIEGTFDDCQTIVKSMFTHKTFRQSVGLSGVNSINWARIVAQIVYYFTAAVALGAPHRKVSFSVPTGNFGDILAGWIAKQMGLPIEQLVIATNVNDILARTLESGRYDLQDVIATASPSMDIQISSNFERVLFELQGRNASKVRQQMSSLKQSGSFQLDKDVLKVLRENFAATCTNEEQTLKTISDTLEKTGYLLDPHTAVGLYAAKQNQQNGTPMVTLATAHPAKFPASVAKACDSVPSLPTHLSDLMDRQEKAHTLPADQDSVESYVRQHARATS
jgi:threonine synthase